MLRALKGFVCLFVVLGSALADVEVHLSTVLLLSSQLGLLSNGLLDIYVYISCLSYFSITVAKYQDQSNL